MADDPIFGEYDRSWTKDDDKEQRPSHLTSVGDNTDLVFLPAQLPDPETIPPRAWLYGTQLLRGYVSILVAPGGVGKTGYAMALGLALATGRALFGEKIHTRSNVAVLNLEDPMDELNRRLAALMLCHGISRSEVEGRYFLYSSDTRRVTVAAVSKDGYEIVHPDEALLIREINTHKIGVLVVDPCAESHELNENSNDEMRKAAGAWRRIARATGCAIFLIHHVRKGTASDIDAARGAKAMTDSARVGLLLSTMTDDEAAEFDIAAEDRHTYVRLDDAKVNMAPKAGVARWFQLKTVELGNATASYPAGDRVSAIVRWQPPGVMGQLTVQQCNEALDEIARGPSEGVLYTKNKAGKTERWAGQVLVDMFDMNERRARNILSAWLANGLLEVREYHDPKSRKNVKGLVVNATKRPGTSIP